MACPVHEFVRSRSAWPCAADGAPFFCVVFCLVADPQGCKERVPTGCGRYAFVPFLQEGHGQEKGQEKGHKRREDGFLGLSSLQKSSVLRSLLLRMVLRVL